MNKNVNFKLYVYMRVFIKKKHKLYYNLNII